MTQALSTFETILVDIKDGAAVITFNRPEVRNALNQTMVGEIRTVLKELSCRDDVNVLIFTGAGEKAFLAGADIKELRERKKNDALCKINSALFREIETFPRPTIAATFGYCLGGGMELVMACDIRIAAQNTKLGQPEVGLGIMAAAGATFRLPRLVGLGKAKELIFTGRIISAQDAKEIGLVEQLVDDGKELEAAQELAKEISKNSRLAVSFSKTALNQAGEVSTEVAMQFESTAQAVLFEDPEKYERMTAFLDKKSKPKK